MTPIEIMARAMFPDAFDEDLPVNMDRALMRGRQLRALARAERGFLALPDLAKRAAWRTEGKAA